MNRPLPHRPVPLARNQFIHFRPPQALRLQALQGTLWVTVDGHPEDFELDEGQSRLFAANERLVVGTLGGPALLCATPQAAATPARGGWLGRLLALRLGHGHTGLKAVRP